MYQLVRIVIPKLKNQWKYLAEALMYDPATIHDIEKKRYGDVELCCRDVLKGWLETNTGLEDEQKVWLTLVDGIKKADGISPNVAEDIFEEVKQLK